MQKNYCTKTAQAIRDFIDAENDCSFSVSDVVAYLDARKVKMNLATVYRNLDRLVDAHKLVKFKAANSDVFQYRLEWADGQCHEHLHLQCRLCGKIIHLDDKMMDQIIQSLTQQYGFEVEYKDSMLSGLCKECRLSIK